MQKKYSKGDTLSFALASLTGMRFKKPERKTVKNNLMSHAKRTLNKATRIQAFLYKLCFESNSEN